MKTGLRRTFWVDTQPCVVVKYIAAFFVCAALLAQQVQAQDTVTLRQAIETTIRNNRRVKIDSAATAILAQRTRLENGDLLPSLSFSSQASHYFKRPVAFGNVAGSEIPGRLGFTRLGGKEAASADLYMELPVLDLRQRTEVEVSRLAEKRYGFIAQGTRVDLRSEVKQVYLKAITLQKRLDLYAQTVSRHREMLAEARGLLHAGKVNEVDTLSIYMSLKELEPDSIELHNALMTAKQRMNLLMGASLKRNIVFTDTTTEDAIGPSQNEEELLETVIAHRPSIKVLEYDEKISRSNAQAARRSALPVIKAVGQYLIQTQTNAFRFGEGPYPLTYYAGLRLTLPILNGYRAHAGSKIAELEAQQARFRQQVAWKVTGADLSELLGRIAENRSRISARSGIIGKARMNYLLTKQRYVAGKAGRIELSEAEYAYTAAGSGLIEAVYDLESAEIELERIRLTDVGINGEPYYQ